MKKNGFANSMYILHNFRDLYNDSIDFEYHGHIIRYVNEIHQLYEVSSCSITVMMWRIWWSMQIAYKKMGSSWLVSNIKMAYTVTLWHA